MSAAAPVSFTHQRSPTTKSFVRLKLAEVPMSDGDLCAALAAGDRRAGDALFSRLRGLVEATLTRLVGAADAERDDLIQQSHERILASVASRRFAGACSLATWARLITEHVVIDALRSRARERRVFDDTRADSDAAANLPVPGPLPDELVDLRREIARAREGLGSVLPQRAEAFVLHDVLGFDLSEMAGMLEISAAAAQSRLVRGRRDLHARLGVGAERGD
jgi:RNA polymerase sigma-70 factor (ECF subfamily)